MSKYLVEVTDLDPKALFDKDKVSFKNIPNSPFSSPFTPPPQKESFPWGLLFLAAFVTLIISPDLRKNINFDYSPTSQSEQLLPPR
jgi:hypothetical protein